VLYWSASKSITQEEGFTMKKFLAAFVVLGLAFFAGCKNDGGTGGGTPTIGGMTPNLVSIGQLNVQGRITGSNLSGVTSVNLGDGITVIEFSSASATEITVRFSVSGTAAPGVRTITIQATGGSATSTTVFSILDNRVPEARFIADPSTGSIARAVSFDASNSTDSDGNIITYHFAFGDGASANGKKVTHKYATVGTYTVVLTVTDNDQATGRGQKEMKVSRNDPPAAVLVLVTPKNGQGSTNTEFEFDASRSRDNDGRLVDYIWNFNDGSPKAHGATVIHVFKKEGKFDVELTVVDNLGGEDIALVEVQIEKSRETVCTRSGNHSTFVRGRVVAVESGNWAIVNFGGGHNCANTFHKCDDFRRQSPENFYGIVDKMTDRGNGIMGVHNSCPYRWPPAVGEAVFLYFKTCQQNHCP